MTINLQSMFYRPRKKQLLEIEAPVGLANGLFCKWIWLVFAICFRIFWFIQIWPAHLFIDANHFDQRFKANNFDGNELCSCGWSMCVCVLLTQRPTVTTFISHCLFEITQRNKFLCGFPSIFIRDDDTTHFRLNMLVLLAFCGCAVFF